MNKTMLLNLAALIAIVGPAALAQSVATAGTNSTRPATIEDRKDDQQDRIANGIQSGQLTAGETKNLETKEAGINAEQKVMRADDAGHLTAADRAKINSQQNQLSHQIYDDKHNAPSDHFGSGQVGRRQQSQQERIANGVQSGRLTAGETARLESQQQSIQQQKSGMKSANGGKLTAGDKRVLNQRENNASKNIYAQKHNPRQR